MTLSPQARHYARRLARNSFRVKPNEAEVAAMRAIIGDDQTFVRLAPAVQRIVFVGIMKARAMRSFTDDYNEIRNVTRRKREAVTLQSALDRLLKILDVENVPRSEHVSLVARAMEARHGISLKQWLRSWRTSERRRAICLTPASPSPPRLPRGVAC